MAVHLPAPAARTRSRRSSIDAHVQRWSTPRWRGRARPRSSATAPRRAAASTRRCDAGAGSRPSRRPPRPRGTSPPSPGISRRDRPAGRAAPPSAGTRDRRRAGPVAENVIGEPGHHQRVSGTVSGLPVFRCTIAIVCPRQSMSASRRPMMSQARSPVVSASRVIAASRALTAPTRTPARPAAGRRRRGPAGSGGNALTPARPTASTRSVRPVNFRNGRKFDTTQNREDFAHLADNDPRTPERWRHRQPQGSRSRADSKNDQ